MIRIPILNWEIEMSTGIRIKKNVADVVITNPQEGDVLSFENGQWVNTPPGSSGMVNPMTAAGQMIYMDASLQPSAVIEGSTNQLLVVDSSGNPAWSSIPTRALHRFEFPGDLSVGAYPVPIHNLFGHDREIISVVLSIGTLPEGQNVIVDVLEEGVTIFPSTKPNFTPASSVSSARVFLGNGAIWTSMKLLTIEITQVGTPTPGANLAVTIVTQR